jgi:hypothetical protein
MPFLMNKQKIVRVIAAGLLSTWLYGIGAPAESRIVANNEKINSYTNFAYGSYLLSSITYNLEYLTVSEQIDALMDSLDYLAESYFSAEMPDEQKAVMNTLSDAFNEVKMDLSLYADEIKEAQYKKTPGAKKMLVDILVKTKTVWDIFRAVNQGDIAQLADAYLTSAQAMYVSHDVKKTDIKTLQKKVSQLNQSIGHFLVAFYALEDGHASDADKKTVVEDKMLYALNEWVKEASTYAFSLGRFEENDKSISAYHDLIVKETALGIPDPTATNNLAYALLNRAKGTGLAMKLADMSLRIKESVPAIDTKARLLAKDHNYDKAISMIQRAMKLSIDSGNISEAEQLKEGIFNKLLQDVRP